MAGFCFRPRVQIARLGAFPALRFRVTSRMPYRFCLPMLVLLLNLLFPTNAATQSSTSATPAETTTSGLRLGVFDVDATPPVGSMLAYDPVTNKWDLGLRARGVVLLGAGDPIVLCAVDWIGIANEGHDEFRSVLARAAGTTPSRVAVHSLHQHDAPDCDFSAEKILTDAGMAPMQFDSGFQRTVLSELARVITEAIPRAQPVTHVGTGQGRVHQVASNRRILGPDGKVKAVRWSATKDEAVRAEPEGVIDPMVSLVSFWNNEQPLALLSYYATHPQSYYRLGIPNPDFPGLARFLRQLALPTALHVHFNGAGGNITAGKYNDGAPANRVALAQRLADGMRLAWESTKREPVTPASVTWGVESISVPVSRELSEEKLLAQMKGREATFFLRGDVSRIAFLRRMKAGKKVDVSCLGVGSARILHMPGELFVEYQLAAKAHRPDLFVAMAGYGDYGLWYVGTAIAYQQGGYETSAAASNVAPEIEPILMGSIQRLLGERR